MADVEAWSAFTQFADRQVIPIQHDGDLHIPASDVQEQLMMNRAYPTYCLDLVQMQISAETFALRHAVASLNASISALCSAGFAELASNYVLGRAEVRNRVSVYPSQLQSTRCNMAFGSGHTHVYACRMSCNRRIYLNSGPRYQQLLQVVLSWRRACMTPYWWVPETTQHHSVQS